jgi:putative phosphoribosyl transferase
MGTNFRDRRDAGRALAVVLKRFASPETVVLALPRGGAPVGFEVAEALQAPLDVLLVRKIGVPGHEELALGAVVDGSPPQVVVNENVRAMAPPPAGYLDAATERALSEIARRRVLYRKGRAPIDVRGRVVIVIDDGIATGATMKAALRGVRLNEPKRLVLAVPVAPGETIAELRAECDEAVCLETPEPFHAVGQYYGNFGQTSDDEVVMLLERANEPARVAHSR